MHRASLEQSREELPAFALPLSAVSNRDLDGRKTATLSHHVQDRGQLVTHQLLISGSDRHGLPRGKDEDVLLACLQLSRLRRREVQFSRYELLKLLGWPDDGRYYARLTTALLRWWGVT